MTSFSGLFEGAWRVGGLAGLTWMALVAFNSPAAEEQARPSDLRAGASQPGQRVLTGSDHTPWNVLLD